MTLTEFLLARIAEDEGSARDPQWLALEYGVDSAGRYAFSARVLAECEAKWRIATLHGGDYDGECMSPAHLDGPCRTLRALALPYAEHPDYSEAWRA